MLSSPVSNLSKPLDLLTEGMTQPSPPSLAGNFSKFSELMLNETQQLGDFADKTLKSARKGVSEAEILAGEMFE